MKEFTQLISGGLSFGYYLAALFFSGLAILLSMWAGSANRNVASSDTPRKYSFEFLIWDNAKRIGAGLIAMFLVYRFTSSIIGHELSMESAVGVGFIISMGVDQLIGWLKQRFDFLQMNRKKIMQILKQKEVS
ncbi:MAG TPA: hypothetical protein VGO58_19350 [Chitinophagaceae bacterium]|jgi:hypothetical protein|nr:hypothetical protein [Chitinophagaceae bacterium]